MTKQFDVFVSKACTKSLNKIPDPWRDRIISAIKYLKTDPFIGEKMWGKLEDSRKIRVWPYRIIYTINEGSSTIDVTEIAHRGNVSYG